MSKKKKQKQRMKKKSIREILTIPETDFEEEVDFTNIGDLEEALVSCCLSLDSKRRPQDYIV